MIFDWRLDFLILPETTAITGQSPNYAPFEVVITAEAVGLMTTFAGAINPAHYLATGLDLGAYDFLVAINSQASGAAVQAGVVRAGLVMTEPASGDLQRWDLDPRTTVDIDADGGLPEMVLPWGQGSNAWITAPMASLSQSLQINNPSGTAVGLVLALRPGSTRVHFNDRNL